jgi:hypothetical protein
MQAIAYLVIDQPRELLQRLKKESHSNRRVANRRVSPGYRDIRD